VLVECKLAGDDLIAPVRVAEKSLDAGYIFRDPGYLSSPRRQRR
jgi:hypothetical protein